MNEIYIIHEEGFKDGTVALIVRGNDIYSLNKEGNEKRLEHISLEHVLATVAWGSWKITKTRPKRMVKTEREGWTTLYEDSSFGRLHASKEEAIRMRSTFSKPLGDPIHIVHEYEIEDDK